MSNPTQPEPSTITGKPITSPVAFRLPISDYARLQEWVGDRLDHFKKGAG